MQTRRMVKLIEAKEKFRSNEWSSKSVTYGKQVYVAGCWSTEETRRKALDRHDFSWQLRCFFRKSRTRKEHHNGASFWQQGMTARRSMLWNEPSVTVRTSYKMLSRLDLVVEKMDSWIAMLINVLVHQSVFQPDPSAYALYVSSCRAHQAHTNAAYTRKSTNVAERCALHEDTYLTGLLKMSILA
jgi:hypothetical protein